MLGWGLGGSDAEPGEEDWEGVMLNWAGYWEGVMLSQERRGTGRE